MGKKNISVIAKFTEDGRVRPLTLIWEDGRQFEINRVTDIRKAASLRAGGFGVRYTCFIRGKQVFLFKDEEQWFMEVEN